MDQFSQPNTTDTEYYWNIHMFISGNESTKNNTGSTYGSIGPYLQSARQIKKEESS